MNNFDSPRRLLPQSSRLAALMLGATICFVGCGRNPEAARQPPAGRNVLVPDVAGKIDFQQLATISWRDVIPTAEAVGSDKSLTHELIDTTAKLRHPPALYFRGLLLLAANNPKSALAAFEVIPVEQIPESLLYAPYRLHNELSPSQPNIFLPAMNRAVEQRQVPPLIQARTLANGGQNEQALKAYLLTDPADWTAHDAVHFRSLRFEAGLANDTAAMLQAALKAGRVRGTLRAELIGILNAPRNPAAMESMKVQLLHQIQTDPATRNAAISSAAQQLSVRRQFVEKKYRELLDLHRGRQPIDLPDETVLILLLSAAQLQDGATLTLWSQEMTRRYPTPEVEKWIRELHAPTR